MSDIPNQQTTNTLRLPPDAWTLLSAHADTIPAFPPAHKGRGSVLLHLLKRTRPPEGFEECYTRLFGSSFDELFPRRTK